MYRHFVCYVIVVGFIENACALPRKWRTTPTTPYGGFDPVVGKLTPSRDVQEFVEAVFKPARNNEEEEEPEAVVFDSKEDSGEYLKPKDPNNKAHVGFEPYWPGGDWVFRKASLDHCNNTATACQEIFGSYGRVCAGNHDLSAHTTFESICEMFDANCRDGTVTTFTSSWSNKTLVWIPVAPNGYVNMKLAVPTVNSTGFILSRNKNITSRPRWSFRYGVKCWDWYEPACVQLNELREHPHYRWAWQYQISYRDYLRDVEKKKPVWPYNFTLSDKEVRHFKLAWNETAGAISLTLIKKDGTPYRIDEKSNFNYQNTSMSFPARYLGLWGGSPEEPVWWELEGPGISRGYMLAYRGKCRPDLPTLPTEQPVTLRHNLDIEMYNFAERMDEFGYNFTRIPLSTVEKRVYYDTVEEDLDDKFIYG